MDLIDILGEIGFVLMIVCGGLLIFTFFWEMSTRAKEILEESRQIKEKLDKDD